MRILYFHQHFTTPQGASGTRSYEFARALIGAGHRVTMVCGSSARSALDLPFDAERGWSRGDIDRIDVIALPLSYTNHDGLAKRTWTFLRFALRSIGVALRDEYDLVFATSTPLTAAVPGIAARILRKKPFVFEVRDLWPELPRALGLRNPFLLWGMSLLEWAAYHSADACIGLSPGIVEGIRRRAQPEKPVAMIPNSCDLDLFRPKDQESLPAKVLGHSSEFADLLAQDCFVAAFTGAHGTANGLDAVLAAAAVLKARGDERVKLLFVGDGKEKDRLAAAAKAQGLDNCHFLPPMPKTALASLISRLGCGLMVLKNVPAFYYGTSPNKFFDYISAGIPVLNNYPGWLAELIREHDCGVVVPPDDPNAFASALVHLANHRDECERMGRNARKLAETQFSREQQAAQFVTFLEECSP